MISSVIAIEKVRSVSCVGSRVVQVIDNEN